MSVLRRRVAFLISVAFPLAFCVTLAVTMAAACSSPSSRLSRMYASLREDVAQHGSSSVPAPALAKRSEERAAEVRKLVAQGEVKSPRDHFQAAVLLVETSDLENLKLAEQLALAAAAKGERLGSRVAAEAVDKQLLVRHLPQRYGTQYEWVAALGAWRLYPIDPKTTDSDRRAMGVAPLVELYEGEKKLNAASGVR